MLYHINSPRRSLSRMARAFPGHKQHTNISHSTLLHQPTHLLSFCMALAGRGHTKQEKPQNPEVATSVQKGLHTAEVMNNQPWRMPTSNNACWLRVELINNLMIFVTPFLSNSNFCYTYIKLEPNGKEMVHLCLYANYGVTVTCIKFSNWILSMLRS